MNGGGNNPPASPGFLPGEDPMYIRDILSGMIHQGVSDFTSEAGKNALSSLAYRVGRPMAIRLMTNAINFNTRSDMGGVPIEQKLQRFYAMGSRDPGVDNIVHRAGMAGYGPIDGYWNTPLVTNDKQKALAGAPPASANPAATQPLAAALKKKEVVMTQ